MEYATWKRATVSQIEQHDSSQVPALGAKEDPEECVANEERIEMAVNDNDETILAPSWLKFPILGTQQFPRSQSHSQFRFSGRRNGQQGEINMKDSRQQDRNRKQCTRQYRHRQTIDRDETSEKGK